MHFSFKNKKKKCKESKRTDIQERRYDEPRNRCRQSAGQQGERDEKRKKEREKRREEISVKYGVT